VTQRAVWSAAIVIGPPVFALSATIVQGEELTGVQALIPKSAIERLYVPDFRGFAGMSEVEFHNPSIGCEPTVALCMSRSNPVL